MKQFLKLATSITVCVCSLAQVSAAFATVTAKCPDSDLLKKMSVADLKGGIVDSQGINWIIETGVMDSQGRQISEVTPPTSFSGWETALAVFQQKNNNDPSYTPLLSCSIGHFEVAGFLPVGPYQSCTLEGKALQQDKDYTCNDANACQLICS